ncbi:hypothetical protein ACFQ60_46340 [Streptomyces zhihengii]
MVVVLGDEKAAVAVHRHAQGRLSRAAVAGPPSPPKPAVPVPAAVLMVPSGMIFRIR